MMVNHSTPLTQSLWRCRVMKFLPWKPRSMEVMKELTGGTRPNLSSSSKFKFSMHCISGTILEYVYIFWSMLWPNLNFDHVVRTTFTYIHTHVHYFNLMVLVGRQDPWKPKPR